MDDDLDEFGEYVGDQEYSNSDYSEGGSNWEDEVDDAVDEEKSVSDTPDLNEPLVKRQESVQAKELTPELWEFQFSLMESAPQLARNVGVVGSARHGKSSVIDWMLQGSLALPQPKMSEINATRPLLLSPRYASFLAQNSKGKSYVFSLADTAGHVDCTAERSACLSICDGMLEIVDVVEGSYLDLPDLPRVVIFNKIDRLILDQRLPPVHTFRRLKQLADEKQVFLSEVIFASSKFRVAFTLKSIAELYNIPYSPETFVQEQDFVKYILEPIYKLISLALIGREAQAGLENAGIFLDPSDWHLNTDERVSKILQVFLGDNTAVTLFDSIINGIPSVADFLAAAPHPESSKVAHNLFDHGEIFTIARSQEQIGNKDGDQQLWIPYGTHKIPLSSVPPGFWYLASSTDTPLLNTKAVLRVDLEPLKPTNESFRKLGENIETMSRVFPGVRIADGASGSYSVYGTGEFYLDTALRFLRNIGDRFRVSPPLVELRETVSSTSAISFPMKVSALSDDTITIITSPVNDDDVEPELVWKRTEHNCYLVGPQSPEAYDSEIVRLVVQGFDWFVNRGPILEGTVTNLVARITSMNIENKKQQLSTTVYRACSAAMLVATPALLEPIYRVVVIGGLAAGKACYSELSKRGGSVVKDEAVLGTNLYKTEGIIPVIDSLGLQQDIMCQLESRDAAQAWLKFTAWEIVKGDPLNETAPLFRLKAAPDEFRARDFMLKVRKAKGLSKEPQMENFVDEDIRHLLTN